MALKGKLLTLVSLVVAVIVALATIQSTQASIDYWFEKPSTMANGLNHVIVYCKNGGGMDGDFYLTVTFSNSSFSSRTDMPYTRVDDSTVRLKFILHKGDSGQRSVYFFTEETAEFSLRLTLQRSDFLQYLFLKANSLFPTELKYQWNSGNGTFDFVNSPQ